MTDRSIFRTVVLVLGLNLILDVLAIAVLSALDKGVPGILENLAVGSLTGLAGLLARGPHDGPQDVTVVNPPGDPVIVDSSGAGEVRLILIFAAAGLLALVLYHFLAPHLN